MKKILPLIALVIITGLQNINAQSWSLTGNSGTISSNFLGTTDGNDLRFRTNNSTRMTINSSGYTGFNVTPELYSRVYSNYSLGTIVAPSKIYSALRGKMTKTTARSNGYLGAYYLDAGTLGGFPTSLNYIGVMGVKEDDTDYGAGVVGWNKNTNANGTHYGIYGFTNGSVSGSTSTDKNVGTYGRAAGNWTNIGVWGFAMGPNDFGGYFSGRGYFSDKVGIGTETPSAMLHVSAPASLSTLLTLSSDNVKKVVVNSSGYLGLGDVTPTSMLTVDAPTSTPIMSLRSNGSTKMYLNASGNLGIGTTGPAVPLHVSGTGELFRLNATSPYMTFHNSNVEKAWIGCDAGNMNIGTVGANTTGNLYFYTNTGARMSIFANGRVAIGTLANTIDAKLNVDNSGSVTQAVFGSSGTGVSILGSYPGIAFNSYYTTAFKAIGTGYGADISCDPTTGNLWFRSHGSANANATQSLSTRMTMYNDGRLVIGNIAPATNYLLSVDGRIMCEELKVQSSGNWPDYVFADDYKLPSLSEVENHINKNGHLMGIPSACEAEENGVSVGDMQKKLLEKIEELTLYVIILEKKVNALEAK